MLSTNQRSRWAPLTCASVSVRVFLLTAATVLLALLWKTRGHLVYCLDDPYIHLALAQRIRHGLYGLNAGEPVSPSSSIVWPFLFVPFAGAPFLTWLPLIFNISFGAATAWLLGHLLDENWVRTKGKPAWYDYAAAVLLVFALNLVGIAYTGLEHSLQVFLCACCALAVLRCMRDEPVSDWTLVAAALLPSVRYEGLLITVGVAIALCSVRRWKTALTLLSVSVMPLIGFSAFLIHLGLPPFPLSVLGKSGLTSQSSNTLPASLLHLLLRTLHEVVHNRERLPQLILTLVLAYLTLRSRHERRGRFSFGGATLVSAVQVVLGPVGWFYRYEIYCLAFTLPIALVGVAHRSLLEQEQLRQQQVKGIAFSYSRLFALAGLLVLACFYLRPVLHVAAASRGIYEQQYQLGRLTQQFYTGPVAINDLGLVSYGRDPGNYVLDLYNLGSYEAFRVNGVDRDAAWLDSITHEHGIGLVAIYPEFFAGTLPNDWTTLGQLCSEHAHADFGPANPCVTLFRTPQGSPTDLLEELQRFRAALPDGTTLILTKP